MSEMACPHCGRSNSIDGMMWERDRACSRCGKRLMPGPNIWFLANVAVVASTWAWFSEMPQAVAAVLTIIAILLVLTAFFQTK